jgi:hypothetical protein
LFLRAAGFHGGGELFGIDGQLVCFAPGHADAFQRRFIFVENNIQPAAQNSLRRLGAVR